jgi:hypothetical protein
VAPKRYNREGAFSPPTELRQRGCLFAALQPATDKHALRKLNGYTDNAAVARECVDQVSER